MKATKLDRKFDAGESVRDVLDISEAHRESSGIKRVSLDFPAWMLHSIDRYARRLKIPRPSLIKVWVAGRLKQL